MLTKSTQTHANTPRHVDDPHDNWQQIGDVLRRIHAKRAQRIADLVEFCEPDASYDDDVFVATFTRFGG